VYPGKPFSPGKPWNLAFAGPGKLANVFQDLEISV